MVLPLFPVLRGYGAGICRQGAADAVAATGETLSLLQIESEMKMNTFS
jgi:hypothetical protein